jgi:flagellar basal body-associated protein FliL
VAQTKSKTTKMLVLILVIVCVCVGAIIYMSLIGREGGSSLASCVSVKIDTIKPIAGEVNVLGTFTNNCSQTVRYAKIETTCYSSSGEVLDRDPEYVENVAPEDSAYFESPLSASSAQVERCESEVAEVDN